MAATKRMEQDCVKNAQKTLNDPGATPLEKLRAKCLERGPCGIKQLGRKFRILDDDGSKSLSMSEFKKGVKEMQLGFKESEIKELWCEFDSDGSGTISFDEFLEDLRPPMSKSRKDITQRAFNKLDKSGDGVVTVEDLKGVYDVRNHKKYKNGEWTEEQVYLEFLSKFEGKDGAQKDGIITQQEFMDYYSGVSSSIDTDQYYILMMTNAWKL